MNQSEIDIFWMNQAIYMANHSACIGEIPVGAILVYKNELIAKCSNKSIFNNDPTSHAEILVLRSAGQYFNNYRFPNTTIYVTLEPCCMCSAAIIHARVSRLIFGAYNVKNGCAGSVIDIFKNYYSNHNVFVSGGVLLNECSNLLSVFFKRKRMFSKKK